jgi:hypothetical protein
VYIHTDHSQRQLQDDGRAATAQFESVAAQVGVHGLFQSLHIALAMSLQHPPGNSMLSIRMLWAPLQSGAVHNGFPTPQHTLPPLPTLHLAEAPLPASLLPLPVCR